MVEIREQTSDSESPPTGNAENSQNSSQNHQQRGGQYVPHNRSLIEFVKENGSEMFCFFLRLVTICMSLCYLIPFASPDFQKISYSKALIAAAATNAFRLNQRMQGNPNSFFSRAFFSELFLEDSAHYLLYCFIFVTLSPMTMALIPIMLYAFLHALNFAIKSATEFGYSNSSLVSKANQLKLQHTSNILSTIACAEIFVFPIIIVMIFMGKANFFVPFVYYRFLTLRYLSRRNPYTRTTFAQLRISLFEAAGHPSCPGFVKNLIYKSVNLVQRLAPIG